MPKDSYPRSWWDFWLGYMWGFVIGAAACGGLIVLLAHRG